jgi:hypothetical protein
MKAKQTKLARQLLEELIRDTETAIDRIGSFREQANADGDDVAASLLRIVWERLNHAGDEFRTAEAVVKSRRRTQPPQRPRDRRSAPV